MAGSIKKMQEAVRAIDKAQPGYDQHQRWSFYDKGKVLPRKETDCSACCGAIAQMGGYPVDLTGTWYTGNFNTKMAAAGFKVLPFRLRDVRVGDFINAPGTHVEFAYSNDQWYSARNDERGKPSGGRSGDQGGRENVGYGRPYDMSKGGRRKAYILRPPAPVAFKPDKTKLVNVKHATANMHGKRFGGAADDSKIRAKALQEQIGASSYSLQEVNEATRYAIRDGMAGGRKRWKLEEVGYVCVMWDSIKYDYKGADSVGFGNDIHGAVRAELVQKSNGRWVDIIAVHVRPNDALDGTDDDKLKAKLQDVQKAIDLRRPGVITWLSGDLNTGHARKLILANGFKAASDPADTVDTSGDQRFDGIYVTTDPDVPVRYSKVIDPGPVSDHKWVLGGLSVPGANYKPPPPPVPPDTGEPIEVPSPPDGN